MPHDIALRALWAIVISCGLFAAWKLTSAFVLSRARKAASSIGFESGKPALLVFGSPLCAPCVHAQKPAVRKLEADLAGALQVIEIDVTRTPALAERYGVISLPTVFVLDSAGEPRRVNHGVVSAEELKRQVTPLLARA